MRATIEQVREQVSVLTADEQQLLKDAINNGRWGDSETEFFKSEDSNEVDYFAMMAYCTNDANKSRHFENRKLPTMFRSIYRKMCRSQHNNIGDVLSHCNDWWGDGSGDMLFIRIEWYQAFEAWAKE